MANERGYISFADRVRPHAHVRAFIVAFIALQVIIAAFIVGCGLHAWLKKQNQFDQLVVVLPHGSDERRPGPPHRPAGIFSELWR